MLEISKEAEKLRRINSRKGRIVQFKMSVKWHKHNYTVRNKQGRVFTKGSVVVVRFLGLSAAKMIASVKERELKVEKRVWIA